MACSPLPQQELGVRGRILRGKGSLAHRPEEDLSRPLRDGCVGRQCRLEVADIRKRDTAVRVGDDSAVFPDVPTGVFGREGGGGVC